MTSWFLVTKKEIWDMVGSPVGHVERFFICDPKTGAKKRMAAAFDDIAVGDRVYGYVSGKGLCTILECSYTKDPRDGTIGIKKLADLPCVITWDELKSDPIITNCKPCRMRCRGSLFDLSASEADAIKQVVIQKNPNLSL